MNIVFMGTPDFAVPVLDAIVRNGYTVNGVITQPDRPSGRGNKLTKCPVKIYAEEKGLPVYQYERLRRQEGLDKLRELAPDIVVTAAFGQILSRKLLEVPRMGTINVHASLLPKHRGSAPINRAIECGDRYTGITTMLTDAGVDTGMMLLQSRTEIGENETAGELSDRLSLMGAELIIETLKKYIAGELTPIAQNEEEATHEPMLSRDDAKIDWDRGADKVSCFIRGMSPWPCAWTQAGENVLKVYNACARNDVDASGAEPGTVLVSSAKAGLIVACGENAVELLSIQASGAKRMDAKAYLAGKTIPAGTRLV